MKKIIALGASFAFPLLAFAQVRSIQDAGVAVTQIINGTLVPLVFAIAFIVFIWGIFQYFIQGGHDEEAKVKGKSLMLYGIVGFFLMVSVWGLVNILVGTFNLSSNGPQFIPVAPGPR
jgi:NADH:ubiquinone oxidoreductase subunit 2 (subunit N)